MHLDFAINLLWASQIRLVIPVPNPESTASGLHKNGYLSGISITSVIS